MDNLIHGKRYTYTKHKCRCPECKRANAEYKSYKTAQYRNLQASAAREDASADAQDFLSKLTHGLPSTYEWFGCRCNECKKAKAEVSDTYHFLKSLSA